LYTYCTVRYSFRRVSTAEDSRKASPKPSSISEKKKSNEKEVSFSPRTSITLRVTIDYCLKSYYRQVFSQSCLSLALCYPFSLCFWRENIFYEIVSKESRNIVSRMVSALQAPISTGLMPYSTNQLSYCSNWKMAV